MMGSENKLENKVSGLLFSFIIRTFPTQKQGCVTSLNILLFCLSIYLVKYCSLSKTYNLTNKQKRKRLLVLQIKTKYLANTAIIMFANSHVTVLKSLKEFPNRRIQSSRLQPDSSHLFLSRSTPHPQLQTPLPFPIQHPFHAPLFHLTRCVIQNIDSSINHSVIASENLSLQLRSEYRSTGGCFVSTSTQIESPPKTHRPRLDRQVGHSATAIDLTRPHPLVYPASVFYFLRVLVLNEVRCDVWACIGRDEGALMKGETSDRSGGRWVNASEFQEIGETGRRWAS